MPDKSNTCTAIPASFSARAMYKMPNDGKTRWSKRNGEGGITRQTDVSMAYAPCMVIVKTSYPYQATILKLL